MEKMKNETLGVALLLPILIFLLFVSVSHAQQNSQVTASVTVNPKPTIWCNPDTLTVGSSVQWIYCFIELDGADVHDINPSNVQLTVVGKFGSVPADPFFWQFGDFDSDGKTDIMLRFSRSSADINWFNSITQTTPFTFDLIGSVRGFPFSGTDPILVIKIATSSSARYFQLNAPDIGNAKINWLYGPSWFNYKNYTPSFLHFSGYFYNMGGSRLFGTSAFYSDGYVNVEKTYHYLLFDRKVIEKQPVTISVYMSKYNDCFFNSTTKYVHCEGPALLSIKKTGTGETYSTELTSFRFDINNYKATLEGGKIWNELIKVSDITMTHIYAI